MFFPKKHQKNVARPAPKLVSRHGFRPSFYTGGGVLHDPNSAYNFLIVKLKSIIRHFLCREFF